MNLTIIIPVHNEERTLEKVIAEVAETFKNEAYEIILVNDGSTDRTPEIMARLEHAKNVRMKTVHHEKNRGKGHAVITGLGYAGGELVAIQDADLEYNPKNLYNLYIHARDTGSIVYGKRDGKQGYLPNRIGNALISLMVSTLFGQRLYDIYTCYKVIPRDLMQSLALQSGSFEIEAEITGKILKKKIDIVELPISYAPRTRKEGKHITWREAHKGILMLLKTRFW